MRTVTVEIENYNTKSIDDVIKDLENPNLSFKEYYNLCIKAQLTNEEIYNRLKCFITSNINTGKYIIFETEKDIYEVYENEKLICRMYKIKNEYYISPNSMIYGLYEECEARL
jgi:hypothetical protein